MLLRLLLLCVFIGLGSASAFAQGFQAALFSVTEPINQDCSGGAPAPDGTLIKIYWDNNLNGPDEADVQPIEGQEFTQVNYNQFALNGVEGNFGPGMFGTSVDFTSVDGMPNNPVYYLEVCIGNVYWQSDTFRLASGYQDVFFGTGFIPWTCVNEACTGCTPPTPPTNVVASDNLCPHILVTWNSDNVDIQFWRIRRDGALIAEFANTGVFSYADPVAPGTYNYQVRAVRVCAPGDTAVSDLVPGAPGEPGTRVTNPPTPIIDNITGACNVITLVYHVNTILGLDSVYTIWEDAVAPPDTIARRGRGNAGNPVTINHNNPPAGVQLYHVIGWSATCGFGTPTETLDALATGTPGQVTGVTITTVNCDSVCLEWNVVANADFYQILRNGTAIDTVADPTNVACDLNGPVGLLVGYTVRAFNECGLGAVSAPPATATRPGPPVAPTGVNATDVLCDRVTVTWQAVANADTYFVFRSGTPTPLGFVWRRLIRLLTLRRFPERSMPIPCAHRTNADSVRSAQPTTVRAEIIRERRRLRIRLPDRTTGIILLPLPRVVYLKLSSGVCTPIRRVRRQLRDGQHHSQEIRLCLQQHLPKIRGHSPDSV
jgi:hypothetical protein